MLSLSWLQETAASVIFFQELDFDNRIAPGLSSLNSEGQFVLIAVRVRREVSICVIDTPGW